MLKENWDNGTRETLQKVIDTMPWSVSIYDAAGRIVMVNRKLCSNVKIKPEEWIGKTAQQLKDEGYIDRTVVTEALQTRKKSYGTTCSRMGVEGLSVCQPLYGKNGDIEFFVVSSPVLKDLEEVGAIVQAQQHQANLYVREIEYLRNMMFPSPDGIFESPCMRTILQTARKIAQMDSTVLITGESGVGKEVVAKIIHHSSTRRNAPFIPINISAIPEYLLESELYGYKKGAFTGALKEGKVGLFEVANGGTLFLDEVGDIPPGMQVKILRAIDSGEITRVGDTTVRKMDVRIIAATNRDLRDEIRKGTFREDLYYRLNVVPIEISPLRERRADIQPLCLYFLERINHKYHMHKVLSPEALNRLKIYGWPGNVRELRNVIERLALLSNQDEISVDDVQSFTGKSLLRKRSASALQVYEDYEQSRILAALKQAEGNRTKAAQLLNMQRSKFYRKLRW